jgi:rhamnosyltransferase
VTTDVSIALVTRNGRVDLETMLPLLKRQRSVGTVEIVAVDSGSTDGTREYLSGRVDRLISIDPAEFGHGRTRNTAIAACSGEFFALIVQDALPTGAGWLSALVDPLLSDATVAGAFARQLPRPEAPAVVRANLERYLAGGATARTIRGDGEPETIRRTPLEQLDRCTFDNVSSVVRRRVWETIPFPDVPIAEDVEWARDVLAAGHSIAYAPDSTVVHSHDRTARYELTRTRMIHHRLYQLFGVRLVPDRRTLIRAILATLADHRRIVAASADRRRPGRIARSAALAVAWPLGQYLGGHDAASGRPLRALAGV